MKRRTILTAAAAAVAVAGLAAAPSAMASPSPASVTPAATAARYFALYSNADSTVAWSATGNPVLTAGTTSGTSAQIDVLNPAASAPLYQPIFTASVAGAGDPRWVIEFHNGCYLFGEPNVAGYTTANDWSVEPGVASGISYAKARAIATSGSCGLDNRVTAAFVVVDAGLPGQPVTLTKVWYGNHRVTRSDTTGG